jgi:peptidoglycan hydrolase-like protein with peptidoglycan-binding domain
MTLACTLFKTNLNRISVAFHIKIVCFEFLFTADLMHSPVSCSPISSWSVEAKLMRRCRSNPAGDPAIKTIQQKLNRLHIGAPLAVDGVSCPLTINAVKLFQSVAGIAIDGIYGAQSEGTYQAIISKPMINQGSTGLVVRYIQYRLGCAIDGQFGAKTKSAVQMF